MLKLYSLVFLILDNYIDKVHRLGSLTIRFSPARAMLFIDSKTTDLVFPDLVAPIVRLCKLSAI